MTDWSQCDLCNGTDIGHLCGEHKAVIDATINELSERAAMSLITLFDTPEKISETPYAMTGIGGSGEVGRLAGVEVWLQNGEPYCHPDGTLSAFTDDNGPLKEGEEW